MCPYSDHIAAFEVQYHSTLFEGGWILYALRTHQILASDPHPQIKLSDTALQMQQCDQNMVQQSSPRSNPVMRYDSKYAWTRG